MSLKSFLEIAARDLQNVCMIGKALKEFFTQLNSFLLTGENEIRKLQAK